MPRTAALPMRVIIADDEKIIADTLAMILNTQGFHAVPVYSGETAVEAARTLKPDVLITDLFMDDLSGVEAAEMIVEILPSCRVLFITAQTTLPDPAVFRIQGRESEVLQKPFRPEDLLRQLENILQTA